MMWIFLPYITFRIVDLGQHYRFVDASSVLQIFLKQLPEFLSQK